MRNQPDRLSTRRAIDDVKRDYRRRLDTLASAAVYAKCDPRTLRRRIADGTITGYRFGPRGIRVDLDEIDDQLLRPIPTVGGAA